MTITVAPMRMNASHGSVTLDAPSAIAWIITTTHPSTARRLKHGRGRCMNVERYGPPAARSSTGSTLRGETAHEHYGIESHCVRISCA
jgi:hypothetical protein